MAQYFTIMKYVLLVALAVSALSLLSSCSAQDWGYSDPGEKHQLANYCRAGDQAACIEYQNDLAQDRQMLMYYLLM